jgi:transmembrane sensor
MNDHEFSRLIEKYQKGQLSGKEKIMVDNWFDSLGNERVKEMWAEEDKETLKTKILNEIRPGRKTVFTGGFHGIYRIAASLILVATLTYLVWQYARVSPEIATGQATASANINKIILPDGSLVWLKGNSKLNFPTAFSGKTRNVSLQGEALFEVTKDPEHPFIIQCGELITTVLGTSFNIKATQKNIEVVVLTGKVSLTSVTDKQGVIVLPNQKAVYNGKQKQVAKIKTGGEEKVEAVKGTEYSMEFEDTRLKEIIGRIEGKFNVKVHTSDPKLNNCMITADFTDQSLETTVNMISQALGFEYEIKDKTVILRGAGCE